jgi:FkbM family methyltransferase
VLVTREYLMQRLDVSERKARANKVIRLLTNPVLYPFLMFFNKLVYPVTHKSIVFYPVTFFGLRMKTLLPSGTDLALNGVKGHDSEIRLSRFLVHTLQTGDTFIDVGAHYGYYTLLASVLVGNEGIVHAVEASASTYAILKENAATKMNITLHHAAASHTAGEITFYEYPGPYAEWNTTIRDAYTQQPWIKRIARVENRVLSIRLDDLMASFKINTAILKIDIEGGELAALQGMQPAMQLTPLTIIMEYHHSPGNRSSHHDAVDLLTAAGYVPYAIARDGKLIPLQDIDSYMREHHLTTDNLVFQKNKTL